MRETAEAGAPVPAANGRTRFVPPIDPVVLPLTAGEMEARLRKLLDDW